MTGFLIKKNNWHFRNRRGLADAISTMLLVMVTVAGSSTLIYFLNDGFVSGNVGTAESMNSGTVSIKLLSYDARDSSSLLKISTIGNYLDQKLCGISCSANPNFIPANNGTEFVVFQIKNDSIDPVFLEQIFVNNVEHVWDFKTSGVALDGSANSNSGKYPTNGKFSLFEPGQAPFIQYTDNEIQAGDTVNVIVKLDYELQDISLSKGIKLQLDVGKASLTEFIIMSGDAR